VCNPVTEVSYTLVTQLSHDRLWMMEHHCERYEHEMSIAIFTNHTYQETILELDAMNCNLDRLKVRVLDASTGYSDSDYPVNALRNLALSQVTTSHIIYIDVDFWTSEHLHDVLMSYDIQQSLMEDPRLALVLPAFMLFRQCREWLDCRDDNLPMMPYTLSELGDMIQNKRGHLFDPTNRGGHGSTLYKEWFHQEPASLEEIPCLLSNRYEPFVVIRYCRDLPPFQAEFSGYGKNKMTWMMQVIRRGYRLSQVGGAYLVHYPHLDSTSRQVWNEAPEPLKVGDQGQVRKPKKNDGNLHLADYKRGQVDQLFLEFRKWLEDSIPETVSRLHPCQSAQDDDSKLWIDHEALKEEQEQKEK
jgi:hypothetical protein